MTLGLPRRRQPAHAFAGPPQRRSRVTPRRRLDQRLEIVKQRVVLGDRSPASSSRPPNALRGLVRRQFLQAPSDGARRNPGRHRDRRNPAITRGKRLRCRNQTPAAFIEKGRHRRKPLSNGFDIDHHHNIWYGKSVVNPYLTLSKVDSIISGRALSGSSLSFAGFRRAVGEIVCAKLVDPTLIDPEMQDCNPVSLNRNNRAPSLH